MNSFQPSDTLRSLTHCPWCEHQFQDLQVYLVAEQESLQLFHFECASCQTNILAVVSLSGMAVASVGVMSDLTRGDVHRLLQAQRIQEDDVIQLHQLLGRPDCLRLFKTINKRP
ncbi:MAG: hypothetical protein AAB558_01585 [Patescibacteria group bacterium]